MITAPSPASTGPAEEADLVRRAQAGDLAAFERLVAAHAPALYTLALRSLGEAQEAEDLLQEALLRAWNHLPGFRAEARLGTWLYRIVINLCCNRIPQLRRRAEPLDGLVNVDGALSEPGPEEGLDTEELRRGLEAAIADLPPQQRLLITLRHLEDLRYDEIAELTGLPLGTVKTGIHRGRRQLRERLSAAGLA